MPTNTKEENPFETAKVAAEWIASVENEKELIRDKEIYPYLKQWVSDLQPTLLLEIGAGQGICSDKIGANDFATYVGIEPSVPLVERAKSLYENQGRKFIIGNAYHLPFEDEYADAVFSVNVWFHLADIGLAASELSRVLKTGGQFLIITVNPKAYDIWESFYFDHTKDGNKIVGKVRTPINPLSSNTFFVHTFDEIERSLDSNSLRLLKTHELGAYEGTQKKLFIAIVGEKI